MREPKVDWIALGILLLFGLSFAGLVALLFVFLT